jgi:hypothetical protein
MKNLKVEKTLFSVDLFITFRYLFYIKTFHVDIFSYNFLFDPMSYAKVIVILP